MSAPPEWEIVWVSHGNIIRKAFFNATTGESISLDSVTRAVVVLDETAPTLIDSSTSPAAFDWTGTAEYPIGSGEYVDVLEMDFGGLGLTAGKYPNCEVILFDAANPDGLIMTDNLAIEIKADPMV